MAKRYCVCGKNVTVKADQTPRQHICNAPDGPAWRDELVTEQPIVPADVDETDPFVSPNTACTHPRGFTWADDGNGHEGSVCMLCGAEEPEGLYHAAGEGPITFNPQPPADREPSKGPLVPASFRSTLECGHEVYEGDLIRADGEGGWECEECADNDAPEENWNGTGRPRPSASTVKMPEPAPQEDKPRLLDMLAAGAAGAGTVLDRMTPEQRAAVEDAQAVAAAGMPGSAGQIMEDAFRDAFVSPTPQGSGPVRGSGIVTNAATAFRPDTADPFSTPTHVAPPLGSATDQPETERDQWGRYVITDPRTGAFKLSRAGKRQGFTRATTYGKTLLDQFGIHQWEMRSVLAGLALRPDLVRAAQGLDVAADKDKLNEIAASAKDAAGGNEAASDGTEFHTVTEWIDTGRMRPEDAPEKFRAEALAYSAKMGEAGLSTEFGWIERVTFTDRGGEDVAGTADRILRERNGQHVIGDVKSGKGIDLAQREIAIQLKVYAMGVNQFGLYNKATNRWEPWTGPPVSEEYGIVMHVPVVRPEGTEAYCDLYRIDLRGVAPYEVSSAMHAAAWVREWRKQKGFASPYHAPAAGNLTGYVHAATLPAPSPPEYNMAPMPLGNPQPAPTRTWAEAFSSVTTPEEANRLWQAAVDAGMDPQSLSDNVALARRALESQG